MQSHIIITLRSCESKHQGFGKRKNIYIHAKMQENSTKQGSLIAFIAQIYKKKWFFLH
jgi:hypothetical protein